MPEATTRMSSRPKRSTAAFTIASQFASELGRFAKASTLPLSFLQLSATFFSSAALAAAITTLAPAPASTFAASAPNAPDAPVTIAVLPLTSNSESGFLRKSSDTASPLCARPCAGHARLPRLLKRWMAGTSPAIPPAASLRRRRDGDQDRAHLVAPVDDLAVFVRTDEAGIVLLEHGLLAAGDHRQLARQHEVDFLRRRSVRPGAAPGQE